MRKVEGDGWVGSDKLVELKAVLILIVHTVVECRDDLIGALFIQGRELNGGMLFPEGIPRNENRFCLKRVGVPTPGLKGGWN